MVNETKEKILKKRFFKLDEVAQFDPNQGKKTIFYETDKTAGAVWCLEPGQEVYKHWHTTSDDLWICIQGTGIFYPGDGEEVEITKGDMIISYPGQQHGMRNTGNERFIFVGVAGPLPMDVVLPKEE
ncbi:cupin domain-containing protein [Alteribacillus bidgolensis]|uniref:Cupin domain-containing protein n=1 Tax=Alteribacillus bidgolensis TaxID=930129 RepID=A0A1G8NGV9_9BACI|nr:cupin domain-containing protein [Alteribacillus bidgolensis]SDI79382.1 Cupin domain-containing protein [Alteribacillus bidgolensis]